MEKRKIFLSVIILSIVLILGVGCGQQKEIDNLKAQAEKYLTQNDFTNAIELYEKILSIKEDGSVRDKLTEIKYEKESIDKTKNFLAIIKDVNINYNRPDSLVELKDICLRLQKAIEDFEKIDVTKKTEIAKYVTEVKNLYEYKFLKDTAYDKYIMDAERSASLAQVSSSMNLGNNLLVGNAAIVGVTTRNLKQHTDYILQVQIPEKYKNML